MIELTIDYNKSDFSAIIAINKSCEAWDDIRRVFQDSTSEVLNVGEYSLKLPWWAFLNCKENLVYHLKKNQIKLRLSVPAESFLIKSNLKKTSYFEAINSQPPTDDLEEVLSMNHFKRQLTVEQVRNPLS